MKPFYYLLCAAVTVMAATSCSKTDALKPAPVPELAQSGPILNGTVTCVTTLEISPYLNEGYCSVSVTNGTDSLLWIAHVGTYLQDGTVNVVGFHYTGPEDGSYMSLPAGTTRGFDLKLFSSTPGDPYGDLKKLVYGREYVGKTYVMGSLGGTAPSRPTQFPTYFSYTAPHRY